MMINVLVGEIMSLAVLVTKNTEVDAFVSYSGHVETFEVRLYMHGWAAGKEPDICQGFLLKSDNYYPKDEIIRRLKKAKNILKKIYYKEKINWKHQPYYIEEVRRYTFS